MPYNTRLKVVKGDEIKYFDIMQLSSGINIGGFKSDYKVVQGNRLEGISQGIGLLNAGRSLSFTIPVFETKEKQDIYLLIAEYTSILSNSFSYDFYIEHLINNFWYSAKVNITEVKGYNLKQERAAEGFGFSCQMIDNFFQGDLIEDKLDYTGQGIKDIEYISKSLTPVNIMFSWNVVGERSFSAYIFHNYNYGIEFSTYFNELGDYTFNFDGTSLTVIEGGVENLIEWKGVVPFLDVGRNTLTVNSNFSTSTLIIKYKEGIAL